MGQLHSEIAAAHHESSEARRLLLERESQDRLTQLKVTTLQKLLQDREQEVSNLEDRLTESHSENHSLETEVARLKSRVATLSTQLSYALAHSNGTMLTQPHKQSDKEKIRERRVANLDPFPFIHLFPHSGNPRVKSFSMSRD
ncbi:hypothetical protein SK128_023667 [Halocaridina rubra]|uniref:Uncharacterized protein n=1 Tax=Halocaridina rubra TaxID=373956 RepID=A0AAN8X9B3_HALRR